MTNVAASTPPASIRVFDPASNQRRGDLDQHAGIVTYLNPAAERQYATSAELAIGRPLSDLYTYRWVSQHDEAAATAALEAHGFWRGENFHVWRDGCVLHVDSSVGVLHDGSGTPVGLLAVVRDVTAAKRAEAELRERELQFRRRCRSKRWACCSSLSTAV